MNEEDTILHCVYRQSYILCQPHLLLLLCLTCWKPQCRVSSLRTDGRLVFADTVRSWPDTELLCSLADFNYLQYQLDIILKLIVLDCWMRKYITVD